VALVESVRRGAAAKEGGAEDEGDELMGGRRNRRRSSPPRKLRPSSLNAPQQGIVCQYAVAILDILDQTEALKLLDALPLPCTKEEMDRVVARTMKPVLEFRRALHSAFRKAEQAPPPKGLPPELQRIVVRMRGWNAIVRSASDTTAVMVSLRGERPEDAPNLGGLYRLMMSSAGTHLSMMVHLRTMLRGGIDVGKAFEIPPLPGLESGTDVYGLVLGRAYNLEHETAGYPRIVVGRKLLLLLKQVQENASSDVGWQVARGIAARCSELLIQDREEKGKGELFMLDFLHPRVLSAAGVDLDQLRSLRDFVASEQTRFGQKPDPTLEERYGRLLAYCDFGIHRLEQHPDENDADPNAPSAPPESN
jgi:hypothetical protein